jgi:hypothetical protein
LLVAMPSSAAPQSVAADQVLTWIAGDSFEQYVSVPTQAVAGPATIRFENRSNPEAPMAHTLTFDRSTEGYNHDVDIDFFASPDDPNGGIYQADVTLTPGRYRFFCALPGHSGMVGELVVSGGPDTTPPTVSASVTGNREPDGDYIGSATVTVTATDPSGIALTEYQLNDQGWQPYTAPVVVSTAGDYLVLYRARDNAGNQSPEQSVPFRVVEGVPPDTTPPTVSASVAGNREPDGDYLGSATVTLTATDAGSGVDRIEYSLDGGAFTRYTDPVVVSSLGSHMFHYRATDRAGNTSPERMESFTVVAPPDTTPPTVSAAVSGNREPDGDYLGSATVTLTATDAGSGVDRIEYSLDSAAFTRYANPVVVSALGAHTVRYRAVDRAGNTSPEGSESFTVVAPPDTTPPTVTAQVTGNREPDGDYLGSATVTLTATDAGSGVDRIEYSLDGGTFTGYTTPVVVNTLGAHTFRYRAVDRAGNTSPEGSESFTVVPTPPEDTTPPTVSAVVTGDREPDGDYIGSALVTISAEDAQSGVDRIEYSLDGAAFTRYTTPVNVTALGAHTVRYRATDRDGNTSAERSESFTIVTPPDTTPPTVSATVSGNREPDGDYIGSATVTITATDTQSGVDRIEYAVDSGGFVRYTVPVVVNTLGAHTIRYRATDTVGNTSAERSESFTVVPPPIDDSTPPTVSATVSGPRDNNGDYVGRATVTITATDTQSGIASIEYTIDGGSWTPYTEPVRIESLGTHSVQFRATDTAGNTSPAATVTFRVVASGPDACPDSDLRTWVIIGVENSGVTNVDTGNGCTINDLIDEDAGYTNHAAFVRHVDRVTDALVTSGILTPREKGSIVRAAARSTVGS